MVYKTNPDYKAPTRDKKQIFHKYLLIFITCKYCGKKYQCEPGDWRITPRACHTHRELWFKEQYQKQKKYEFSEARKAMRYSHWKVYVIKNIEKRRRWALESYHRNKNKPANKLREHRRTQKPT